MNNSISNYILKETQIKELKEGDYILNFGRISKIEFLVASVEIIFQNSIAFSNSDKKLLFEFPLNKTLLVNYEGDL